MAFIPGPMASRASGGTGAFCPGWRHHAVVFLHGSLELDGAAALLQNRPLFQAIFPDSLWARDNRWLLSRVQRLARLAGGQGPFVPVGATNRDKRPWPPLSPSLSPRPSHSAHLFLAVLSSGERSSCSFLHHICEDLWFPVHPSAR